ncbi:MAG: L-2-amino-thiazoline-4-carboxylic acid hydrolase [Panacagrimonas sp.]
MSSATKPFATIEAKLWRWRFLSGLRRELGKLGLDKALVGRIDQAARAICEQEQGYIPDRKGVAVLAICALALATHRELSKAGVIQASTDNVIRGAFHASFSSPTRAFVKIVMAFSRDPVALLGRVKLSEVFVGIFGIGFEFEDRLTENGVELRATKCWIFEFFSRHGEPALTSRMCEWDKNWMKPIQESRHGVTVARTVTMAASGTPHCEFHFKRSEKKHSTFFDIAVVADSFEKKASP